MALTTVLIPAYNEAENLAETILAVQEAVPLPRQIIVVDDGSTDNTFEIAQRLGVEVYRLENNQGKGGALNSVLHKINGDYVLLIDADLGYSAKEVDKLLEPVAKGIADVAIAKFPKAKKSGLGLVKTLAKFAVYLHSGKLYDCILSGQRAMTKEVFDQITPFTFGYSLEVSSTIKIACLGLKIAEVPVEMTHRVTDRSWQGFCHRGKQFWHILRFLVQRSIF